VFAAGLGGLWPDGLDDSAQDECRGAEGHTPDCDFLKER
jgi:hypothetical protein